MDSTSLSRVAELVSDTVVLVGAQVPGQTSSRSRILHISPEEDLTVVIHRAVTSDSCLVSIFGSENPRFLLNVTANISQLSSFPLVLHLPVNDDLSSLMLLQSATPLMLLSRTAAEAYDHALIASRLARQTRMLVIHAFYSTQDSHDFPELPEQTGLSFVRDYNQSQHSNGDFNEKFSTAASLLSVLVGRRLARPLSIPEIDCPLRSVILTVGKEQCSSLIAEGIAFVPVSLLSPFPTAEFLQLLSPPVQHVLVLEDVKKWSTKYTPIHREVVTAIQSLDHSARPTVFAGIPGDSLTSLSASDVSRFMELAASSPSERMTLGRKSATNAQSKNMIGGLSSYESEYLSLLRMSFEDRLDIVNSPEQVARYGPLATTPEFALGRIRGMVEDRVKLIASVETLLRESALDPQLHRLLSEWLLQKENLEEQILAQVQALPTSFSSSKDDIVRLRDHLKPCSRWIVGSDTWSYDIGSSGLHHLIASKLNVNMLIFHTTPYTTRHDLSYQERRKHDVGLYAMNHGDVYVASIAVYSSRSQTIQALAEADAFNGPSVVLAYLPYTSPETSIADILRETQLAVDAGYWPLYRWNPSKEGDDQFVLESEKVKDSLKEFLDRQNHLSQLVRVTPKFDESLVGSVGRDAKDAKKKKAQESYNSLLSAMNAPPLLILFASDGGGAEKMAKRLANRAKLRGVMVTSVAPMDSAQPEHLGEEEYVIIFTSTAGQGGPPQNGRLFSKALNSLVATGQSDVLCKVHFSVFGRGDSKYWPRPEDSHYFNRPARELDSRFEQLGAQRFVPLGLGNDQDPDGQETAYKAWEPLLWKALRVDSVEVKEAEPEPITNEHVKAASRNLRGTLVEGLENTTSAGLSSPTDIAIAKFHGVHLQDDRDLRDERQLQGLEPAYNFMLRVRLPGGVCTPAQWLQIDQIADEYGEGRFKLTSRQTFQMHGILKKNLKPSVQSINRALMDSIAACGDVPSNIVCSSSPTLSGIHAQIYDFAKRLSDRILPRSTAYHEIWLDKKMVAGGGVKDFDPFYGDFYLPRKFKVAIVVPPSNDVDVFVNDMGFIAILDDQNQLTGFNVTIGGGQGVTFGNKKTYPRIADVIGFCTVDQAVDVTEKVLSIQRDRGNRADRKTARLKYTVDRMSINSFKEELQQQLGYSLSPAKPFSFRQNVDAYGWTQDDSGKHHFNVFVENGRVRDQPGRDCKSGLREIAKIHKGNFRLTTNQHVWISDIATEDVPAIKEVLARYRMDSSNFTGLRLSSSACVALPSCPLAMAESERYLPLLIDKLDKICEENGLQHDSIVVRMSGCPAGCSRPYVSEIGLIGKAPGTYAMVLGGGYYGHRLSRIYRESVTEPEILAILGPMIKQYAIERVPDERFGDFVIRAGLVAPAIPGQGWHEL